MPDPTDLIARFDPVPHGDDVRPNDADLDAFQQRCAVRLPESYRRFIKALGAGTIDDVGAIIAAPVPVPADHPPDADLTRLNARLPYGPSALDALRAWIDGGDARPEVLALERRLRDHVFFCLAAEGDDHFAWDPADVTDPATGEMAVDLVQLHHLRVRRVAATFAEFVLDFLLSGRYRREESAGAEGYSPDPGRVVEYYQYPYTVD